MPEEVDPAPLVDGTRPDLSDVVEQGGPPEHGSVLNLRDHLDGMGPQILVPCVLVLEIDVRLQERNRLEGTALYLSNATKFVLYGFLFLAAVYWGFKGDFLDFWDAFLWLVAFVFIEMNVFEWRAEENQALAEESLPST